MTRFVIALSLVMMACGTKGSDAVDSVLPAVDTIKPIAAETAGAMDTVTPSAASTAANPTRAQAKASAQKSTPASGSATPRDTTNIGRDRAIQIDTKDPRRILPTVDTSRDTSRRRPPR